MTWSSSGAQVPLRDSYLGVFLALEARRNDIPVAFMTYLSHCVALGQNEANILLRFDP
jgi:hypothetical protein